MSRQVHLEPVDRPSTPSIIADKLRQAIADGELPQGQQLFELDLARKLGVSRGPLREGMQRLTQEGLLLAVRNRGLFVIRMTPERVRDMYIVRTAIERAAAEQIFLTDAKMAAKELLLVVEQLAQAVAVEDSDAIAETDLQFHQTIVSMARSPWLSRIHETLLTETRMCLHALGRYDLRGEERVTEHRAIAEAFKSGNQELVDSLIVAHMKDGVTRLAPMD